MEDINKKDRFIVVFLIIFMLFIVLIAGIVMVYSDKTKHKNDEIEFEIKQIYTSDYELNNFDNAFYYGTKDKRITLIVDMEGKEKYLNEQGIIYENIFCLEDGNYLIYNNKNNVLNTYIYDGNTIKELYSMEGINYAKPILYMNDDKQYIIGFVVANKGSLYLYNLNNTGSVVLENTYLVGDNFKDNIYYVYNKDVLVVKNEDGLYGAIDKEGNVIVKCQYEDLVGTVNGDYIAISKKYYYGILNAEGKKMVDFKYNLIIPFKNSYLISKNGKIALFNEEYKKVIDYKIQYDTKKEYSLRLNNEFELYEFGNKSIVLNNIFDVTGRDMYVISDGKILFNKKQKGFGILETIYSYDEQNAYLYDNSFNLLQKIKLQEDVYKIEKISLLHNDLIEVKYLNNNDILKNVVYNKNGEIEKHSFGEFVYKTSYYVVYKKQQKDGTLVSFVSNEGKVLGTIKGNNVVFGKNFIIVDYGIYDIVLS